MDSGGRPTRRFTLGGRFGDPYPSASRRSPSRGGTIAECVHFEAELSVSVLIAISSSGTRTEPISTASYQIDRDAALLRRSVEAAARAAEAVDPEM